jgi:uncharacterized protein (TIGR02099 family)
LSGYVLLICYFAACAAVLGARYWLLPNINDWRPAITDYLSAQFGVQVQASHIEADWRGRNPRIALTGVSLAPAHGHGEPDVASPGSLEIPRVSAQLDWRSLLLRRPAFVNLEASGIRLDIRRDTRGRYHALGQVFKPDLSGTHDGLLGEFLAWLQAQQHIALRNVSLRWTDEMRAAPPLQLEHVSLALARQGSSHSFTLEAQLPPELGQTLDIRGEIGGQEADAAPQVAQLYASASQLRPDALSPWLDIPQTLAISTLSAQARLELRDGRPASLTALLDLEQGNWHPGFGAQIAADRLQLYLSGPVEDYQRVFRYRGASTSQPAPMPPAGNPGMAPWDARHALKPARPAGAQPASEGGGGLAGLQYRIKAQGLAVTADYLFNHPLDLGDVAAQGHARQAEFGALEVDVAQARIANADAQASVSGSWRQGGSSAAGMIDLTGQVQRASIAAIDHYLPERINEHASHWLEHGLLGGELLNASLVLKGDLAHFPFQEQPEAGDFRIAGPYEGGIIDYLPASKGEPGWPRLESMRGTAELHRADLRLTADTAVMRPTPQTMIRLKEVRARIPNLEHESVLTVQGDTSGQAASYLALMAHSPLGGLLDHVFDESSADGDWQVPLSLSIPLAHAHDTTVDGAIVFAGNTVTLMPGMPALSDTRGKLLFTHEGAVAQDLTGSFLGGRMTLGGEVGGKGKGLRMQGRIQADALARYANIQGLRRLSGSIPYDALLAHEAGKPYALRISSDLKGLAVDLPAPLGKASEQSRGLTAVWSRLPDGKGRQLAADLDDMVHVRLRHEASSHGDAFFQAGAVGVGLVPQLPESGMSVNARYPEVAIDTWLDVEQAFSSSLDAASHSARPGGGQDQAQAGQPGQSRKQDRGSQIPKAGRPLLPPLAMLRLQSEKATFRSMALDNLTLAARQGEAGAWRVEIDSRQTAGTVSWKEADGRISGPVRADFSRLAIGTQAADSQVSGATAAEGQAEAGESENPLDLDDEFDIPAVDLAIQDLSLYGRHVGTLSLKGVNQSHGELWRLESFQLNSPHAKMTGSGLWRLSGRDRGLTIKAHADIRDLGSYVEQIGFGSFLSEGSGTLDGEVEWRNMPWAFSLSDVNGTVSFDLAKGRFSKVDSYSARLLELLSLQSVKRLARLDFNPGSLMRDGFPFDNLRGTLVSRDGVLSTHDYRINGPAGTIALEGKTSLMDKTLDLQAVVIPNLDVSGAAIAAGIAINPIVGVGAFLGQWLLQAPLSQAMAAQYRISGTWDEPEIQEVPAAQPNSKPESRPEPPA